MAMVILGHQASILELEAFKSRISTPKRKIFCLLETTTLEMAYDDRLYGRRRSLGFQGTLISKKATSKIVRKKRTSLDGVFGDSGGEAPDGRRNSKRNK